MLMENTILSSNIPNLLSVQTDKFLYNIFWLKNCAVVIKYQFSNYVCVWGGNSDLFWTAAGMLLEP